MKLLILSNKTFAQVDDEDFERLSKFNWQCGKTMIYREVYLKEDKQIYSNGYQHICIPLANEVMNRPNIKFDHADRDYKNNQKSNLRECNSSQNNANKEGYSSTGFKGVVNHGKKFRARINFNKKQICLGTFTTAEEAAKVYDKKAKELYGEFAFINFPNN